MNTDPRQVLDEVVLLQAPVLEIAGLLARFALLTPQDAIVLLLLVAQHYAHSTHDVVNVRVSEAEAQE